MKKLIEQSYKAIQNRGLITRKTKHVDFFHKLNEEVCEVKQEFIKNEVDKNKLGLELSDVIIVCLNWAKHYEIDIEKLLNKKTLINEQRANNIK